MFQVAGNCLYIERWDCIAWIKDLRCNSSMRLDINYICWGGFPHKHEQLMKSWFIISFNYLPYVRVDKIRELWITWSVRLDEIYTFWWFKSGMYSYSQVWRWFLHTKKNNLNVGAFVCTKLGRKWIWFNDERIEDIRKTNNITSFWFAEDFKLLTFY